MKIGIIYSATGPSGKIYIGKTVQPLHRRKICHKSNAFNKNVENYNCHFYKAIRKYSFDKFEWRVLYRNIKESKLSGLERKTIAGLNTIKFGYNSTEGGEGSSGFKHTEKSKIKMSIATKGQVVSDETRAKLSKIRKGKNKSKKHIEKIKQSNIITKQKQFSHLYKEFYVLKEGSIIGKWLYPAECAKYLGLQLSLIWKCLKKERQHHKGYRFKYV